MISSIIQAFSDKKYDISFRGNYFKINNSLALPDKTYLIAAEIMKGYYFIRSESRIGGRLAFTIVPFARPDRFEKVE